MATADAADSFEAAAYRAILFDSLDEVGAAGWGKPASSTKDRAEKNLITAHADDQEFGGELNDEANHAAHDCGPNFCAKRCDN